MKTITVGQLRQNPTTMLAEVEAGETYSVTRHSREIARIVPVIDRAPDVPGLVIATGMCGHGFGIGPGMGRVVADLVAGRAVGHNLTRFRLSRFSDGSKLRVGTGL